MWLNLNYTVPPPLINWDVFEFFRMVSTKVHTCLGYWQPYDKRRSLSRFTFCGDGAMMSLHDFPANGKTDTGAFILVDAM